jgi:hypothetical protein
VPVRIRAGRPVPSHLVDGYTAAVRQDAERDLDALTVAELDELLASRGIEVPKRARKSDKIDALRAG